MTDAVHPNQILYTVGMYDRDGDLLDDGVFLHFGSATVKAAESIDDFKTIVDCMKRMVNEIEEHHEVTR